MKRVVLIGGATGREHAIVKQFNEKGYEISALLSEHNKYIKELCTGEYQRVNIENIKSVLNDIISLQPDYVIIEQEETMRRDIVDMLKKQNIPCIGATKKQAQIENSKIFCRKLLEEIDSNLNPKYKEFYKISDELNEYIYNLKSKIVIKCDHTITGVKARIYENNEQERAIENAKKWIEEYHHIIIEEYIEGQEIAVMCYSDGSNLIHTPLLKNYKRIGECNLGENTLGMGTITGKQFFTNISKKTENKIHEITEKVINKIGEKCEEKYLGSLYGEFIVSGDDVKVMGYNCTFGNPALMNILSIMKISFPELCEHILNGTINELKDIFDDEIVSLSAYVVPKEYTLNQKYVGTEIDFSDVNEKLFYCGNMDYVRDKFYLKNSRAFAVSVAGENIKDVKDILYNELSKVKGNIYYRRDIGNG